MHSADRDTFLEGTNITFTCSPGLVLTGPNTSTCMGNGEWEPNPREVECKGVNRKIIIDHYSHDCNWSWGYVAANGHCCPLAMVHVHGQCLILLPITWLTVVLATSL